MYFDSNCYVLTCKLLVCILCCFSLRGLIKISSKSIFSVYTSIVSFVVVDRLVTNMNVTCNN